MNTDVHSQGDTAGEAASVHPIPAGSASTGTPPFFRSLSDSASPDAELVQLGRDFEAFWAIEIEVYRQTEGAADYGDAHARLESEATDSTGHLVCRIASIPATTLEGLKVKARALHWCRSGRLPAADLTEGQHTSTDALLTSGIVDGLRTIKDAPTQLLVADDEQAFADAVELGRMAKLELDAHSTTAERDDPAHIAVACELTDRLTELLARCAVPAKSPRVLAARAAAVPHLADYLDGCVVPEGDAFHSQLVRDILTVGAPFAVIPPTELDAPILAAWNEHQRLVPMREVAVDAETELERHHQTSLPDRPSELKVRDTDFPRDSIRFVNMKVGEESFYDERVVTLFRRQPRTRIVVDHDATVEMRIRYPDAEQAEVVKRTPNAEDQSRADEIVAAWDRWQAACESQRQTIGLTAAAEESFRLEEQLHRAGDLVRDIPALSLKGVGIKASWALQHTVENERDLVAVLQQVEAFAHRHAYVSAWPSAEVHDLEREMALPPADWDFFRLFQQWLVSAIETDTAYDEEAAGGDMDPSMEAARRTEILRHSLIKMPVTSIEAVRLKAHVFSNCFNGDQAEVEIDLAEMLESGRSDNVVTAFCIARDLARLQPATSLRKLADRLKPTAEAPDQRALEAYRTWLSNEFRSLTAEMYPDNPEMTRTIGVNNAGDRFHFRGEPPASTRAERVLSAVGVDWTTASCAEAGETHQVAA